MFLIDLHIGSDGRSVDFNLTCLVYMIKSWRLLDRSEQRILHLSGEREQPVFEVSVGRAPLSGANDTLAQRLVDSVKPWIYGHYPLTEQVRARSAAGLYNCMRSIIPCAGDYVFLRLPVIR